MPLAPIATFPNGPQTLPGSKQAINLVTARSPGQLTEQAVELKSELEQLRESSKNLQELVDASDEVEEGHVELEQQLQRELDAKASELGHYKVQLI